MQPFQSHPSRRKKTKNISEKTALRPCCLDHPIDVDLDVEKKKIKQGRKRKSTNIEMTKKKIKKKPKASSEWRGIEHRLIDRP